MSNPAADLFEAKSLRPRVFRPSRKGYLEDFTGQGRCSNFLQLLGEECVVEGASAQVRITRARDALESGLTDKSLFRQDLCLAQQMLLFKATSQGGATLRYSPTAPAQHSDTQVNESQLRSITDQLAALHGDLYWMAMEAIEKEPLTVQLNFEVLTGLKNAVDAARLLLWKFIETAAQINPERAQEALEIQRVKRSTEFLQLLRKRLGPSTEQGPVSFIEMISAAVEDRLRDKPDRPEADVCSYRSI